MDKTGLLNWLYDNGGPVIRHRVRTEFDFIVPALAQSDLFNSPLVVKWLNRLQPELGFNQLHGALPTTFENVMGKLTQLGCRSGMLQFDLRVQPFLEWFRENANLPVSSEYSWKPFIVMLMAPFLARARNFEESLREFATSRLETLYQFCRRGRYDIYVDPAVFKGIPKAFQGQPLVDPDLTAGGVWQIPTIYDIHLLANFPPDDLDTEAQKKIETVVGYLFDQRYQSFPEGYGIMQASPRKYYALGWSVHLPGFFDDLENHRWRRSFIQRIALMSRFEAAWQHPWFREGVAFLEGFKTPQGGYLFPREYLVEKPSGYWVTGPYMGLEENRRKKITQELESTFWMMNITNRSEK